LNLHDDQVSQRVCCGEVAGRAVSVALDSLFRVEPWVSAWVVAAVLLPVAALAVVGVVSWRRTSALRSGGLLPSTPCRARIPGLGGAGLTSRTTLIPAASGVALAVAGAAGAGGSALHGRGLPVQAVVVSLVGVAVWSAGFATRVTTLRVHPAGFGITWRLRPPLTIRWQGCCEVRPPRWPLGGWTLRMASGGRAASRMLMSSDLLGREGLLASVVALAGLSFDGRAWTRPSRP
jgi:hypothetical protein